MVHQLGLSSVQFSSVTQSCPALCDPHESQHVRPPCPPPTPGAYSNSCPLSLWCHPAVSSSVVPFSSCPQSLPASGTFPMSQLFSTRSSPWQFAKSKQNGSWCQLGAWMENGCILLKNRLGKVKVDSQSHGEEHRSSGWLWLGRFVWQWELAQQCP